MKERVIFYPILAQNIDLFSALQKVYKEVQGVCLSCDYKENRKVGYFKNRNTPEEFVLNIKQIDFSNHEILIVADGLITDEKDEDLEFILRNVDQYGLRILYNGSDNKFIDRCKNMGISISSVDLHEKSFDYKSKNDVYNKFISMVPVIFVGGIVDICDNRDITLKIKDEFEIQGFRCLAITSEAESNFVGCYQFPKKFMSDEINPISQIISLNNLVFELDFRIKPDVIIIKLPNGIMQISNSMHNGFGIYADMIKKVLSPDYFICTIPIDHVNEMSLSIIDKYVKEKFGSNHLVYHLSNVYCNYQTDLDSSVKKPLYLSENIDNLNRLIDNSTYFNLLDNLAIQKFVKSIIEKNQPQISE